MRGQALQNQKRWTFYKKKGSEQDTKASMGGDELNAWKKRKFSEKGGTPRAGASIHGGTIHPHRRKVPARQHPTSTSGPANRLLMTKEVVHSLNLSTVEHGSRGFWAAKRKGERGGGGRKGRELTIPSISPR